MTLFHKISPWTIHRTWACASTNQTLPQVTSNLEKVFLLETCSQTTKISGFSGKFWCSKLGMSWGSLQIWSWTRIQMQKGSELTKKTVNRRIFTSNGKQDPPAGAFTTQKSAIFYKLWPNDCFFRAFWKKPKHSANERYQSSQPHWFRQKIPTGSGSN